MEAVQAAAHACAQTRQTGKGIKGELWFSLF